MHLEPQIRKQSVQAFKPAAHCRGACARTAQGMLAGETVLDCGSDIRESVLEVAFTEPVKDRDDALFDNSVVHEHLAIRMPNAVLSGAGANRTQRLRLPPPPHCCAHLCLHGASRPSSRRSSCRCLGSPTGANAGAAAMPCWPSGCGPSTRIWGSHSSHLGRYQFHFPRSSIAAGTRTERTIVASISTAAPRPNPPNTATMISAAPVMMPPVVRRPNDTAPRLSPVWS